MLTARISSAIVTSLSPLQSPPHVGTIGVGLGVGVGLATTFHPRYSNSSAASPTSCRAWGKIGSINSDGSSVMLE